MSRKVAVLKGGESAEREVSLETGRAVAGALRRLGHEVVEIDAGSDLPFRLAEERPDVAFIALHGRLGEDGTVQGLLEVMRIPYTGCGVMSSAMTIDKVVTKQILRVHGIPVAEDVVLEKSCRPEDAVDAVEGVLTFPVVVKPVAEGSSIGVSVVDDRSGLGPALDTVFRHDERALVEEFVRGRLLTVGIIGAEPVVLPVLEIKTREGFYDYRAKYQPGLSEYEVPARLRGDLTCMVQRIALESFTAMRCEGISRVDIMLEDDTDRVFVLEINTVPGMTALSLVPKAAAAAGIGFEEVVACVLEGASLKIQPRG